MHFEYSFALTGREPEYSRCTIHLADLPLNRILKKHFGPSFVNDEREAILVTEFYRPSRRAPVPCSVAFAGRPDLSPPFFPSVFLDTAAAWYSASMSRVLRFCPAFLIAALALAVPAASAQNDSALTAALQSMVTGFQGHVSFYAHDLASGQTVALDADQPVPTASVIKLAILYEALQQIRAGRVHFDDRITLRHEDQVQGSGVLLFYDTPMTITFKDALTLMIALSDNTAANLSIDHVGIQSVDDRLVSLGMKNTWLYKKVYQPATGLMPADQKEFGLGKTTAREMGGLMERFATCNLGPAPAPSGSGAGIPTDQALCADAMHMLEVQFYRNSIPRYLEGADAPKGITAIANKTGALDHVRNDVGAVFTKQGSIIISAFTHDNADTSWTPDNQAEVLMAKLARAVVAAWAPGT
jgi:beta-lactamase class A